MDRWEDCYWCDGRTRIEEGVNIQPQYVESIKRWLLVYDQACSNGHPLWTEYRTAVWSNPEITPLVKLPPFRTEKAEKGQLFHLNVQPRTDVSVGNSRTRFLAALTLVTTMTLGPNIAYTNELISERFIRNEPHVESTK